jgi:oxygen-independent coproporphyrinogen III oxidase
VANNNQYIIALQAGHIPFEEEILTPVQCQNEYVMTSLRTANGIDLSVVQNRFGKAAKNDLLKAAQPWLATEKLHMVSNSLQLSQPGKLFADGIAASLFV